MSSIIERLRAFPFNIPCHCAKHQNLNSVLNYAALQSCSDCNGIFEDANRWLYVNMGEPPGCSNMTARWTFCWQDGIRLNLFRFRTQEDAALFKVFFS